ncbi:MAG: tetratricopeptide repeat protein, partial [Candidatus Latescibacterota bacterium]|nr:tetratricopeptide repeat protein [Candidatus Latescibacterota bacterium]
KFFEVTYIRPLLSDPNNDLVRLNMAKSHIESEEFNLALGHLPLVSGTFKAQALYLIGYSYAGLGDYENASKYVEQALEMDPQHTGYMESLCWIYYEMISSSSEI